MFLHHHLRGAVVLVLHVVADNSEVRLRPPAGFDLAAPREAVAFALQKHVIIKGLWIEKKASNGLIHGQFTTEQCPEQSVETHHSSCLIVMAVHSRACVGSILPRISELPGYHGSKLHILAAAAPFPSLTRWTLVAVVASANGGGTLRAGTGDGEGHSRRGDRVHKCRLSGCYDDKLKN